MVEGMDLVQGREFTSLAQCLHARGRKALAARGCLRLVPICVGKYRPIYLSWCTELHSIGILRKSFEIFNKIPQYVHIFC